MKENAFNAPFPVTQIRIDLYSINYASIGTNDVDPGDMLGSVRVAQRHFDVQVLEISLEQ